MTVIHLNPTAAKCGGVNHQPLPVSRDIHEPQDREPTQWRCRHCGVRVDPTTRKALRDRKRGASRAS